MPPRRAGAQGEDQKRKNFDDWQDEEANRICVEIMKHRKNENHEMCKFNAGTDDIIGDWKDILEKIFKLGEAMKVPGRKAKRKLQINCLH